MADPTPLDSTSTPTPTPEIEEFEGLLKKVETLNSELGDCVSYNIETCEVNEVSTPKNISLLRSELDKLVSLDAHIKLAKLTARLLFMDKTFSITQTKSSSEGAVVVFVDALTRRKWVSAEDLAKSLKFDSRLLSNIITFLKEKHFLKSSDDEESEQELVGGKRKRPRKPKIYHSLAYDKIPRIALDANMKAKEKCGDDLNSASSGMCVYLCETCNREYTSLEAGGLLSDFRDGFECPDCRNELIDLSSQLQNKVSEALQKLEDAFEPFRALIEKIENLLVPNFGTGPEWPGTDINSKEPDVVSTSRDFKMKAESDGTSTSAT